MMRIVHSFKKILKLYSTSAKPHHKSVLKYNYPPVKQKYPPGRWDQEISSKNAWAFHEKAMQLNAIPKAKDRLEHQAGSEDYRYFFIKPGYYYSKSKLEYEQYITQTHLVDGNDDFPDLYKNINVLPYLDRAVELTNSAIESEKYTFRDYQSNNDISENDLQYKIAHSVIRNMLNNYLSEFSGNYDHLKRAQIDENVRLESFWNRGGFFKEPDKKVKFRCPKLYSFRFSVETMVNFQVRTEDPLPNFVTMDSNLCTKSPMPYLTYHPLNYCSSNFGRRVSVNGHWLGDNCEFTHLGIKLIKDVKDWNDKINEWDIYHMGFLNSFASTLAQSYNAGFNYYTDLAFPFLTQTLVTNGKWICGFLYQLNNVKFWSKEGPRNLCWKTPTYELTSREGIELFLKFLLQRTEERENARVALPNDISPKNTDKHFNFINEEEFPYKKLGQFEVPKNAIYY